MLKLSLIAGALFCALISTPANSTGVDVHGYSQGNAGQGRAHTGGKRKVVAGRHSHHRAAHRHIGKAVTLAGVTPVLAAKAREITASCGSVVISAVAGRSNRSNHPKGRAVDLQGNPACIYAHLQGWPGGYSTDYATAPGGKHVHVSYNPGGQEWGVRFVHRHGRPRYAARHRMAHAL